MDTIALLDAVDRAGRDLWDANATEPYVHAEYVRRGRVYTAWLTILTGGDVEAVEYLRDFWADCQEDIRYMLGEWFSVKAHAAQDAADRDTEDAAWAAGLG